MKNLENFKLWKKNKREFNDKNQLIRETRYVHRTNEQTDECRFVYDDKGRLLHYTVYQYSDAHYGGMIYYQYKTEDNKRYERESRLLSDNNYTEIIDRLYIDDLIVSESSSVLEHIQYDENHHKSNRPLYFPYEYKYIYNDNGQLIMKHEMIYDSEWDETDEGGDDKLAYDHKKIEYRYNMWGLLGEEISYYRSREIPDTRDIYEYDDKHRLCKKTHILYLSSECDIYYDTYEYNDLDQLICKSHYIGQNEFYAYRKTFYEYDKNGNCVLETEYIKNA